MRKSLAVRRGQIQRVRARQYERGGGQRGILTWRSSCLGRCDSRVRDAAGVGVRGGAGGGASSRRPCSRTLVWLNYKLLAVRPVAAHIPAARSPWPPGLRPTAGGHIRGPSLRPRLDDTLTATGPATPPRSGTLALEMLLHGRRVAALSLAAGPTVRRRRLSRARHSHTRARKAHRYTASSAAAALERGPDGRFGGEASAPPASRETRLPAHLRARRARD